MAIRTYEENGKKLYEVYVNGFNSRGMRVQLKRRGIETLQKSKTIEFELKRELANLKEEKVPYRFGEWFDVCMKRMRLEFQPSTIAGYEAQVIKWVHPHWENKELNTIDRAEVYDLVFHKCAEINTPITRLNLLKRLKRLFQMAIEEGDD